MNVDSVDGFSPVDFGDEWIITSGVSVRILPENFNIETPPHQIGVSFITEGVVLPSETTIDMKGRKEVKCDMTPFVLSASMDGKKSWTESEVKLQLSMAPLEVNGSKLLFPRFDEFEGMIDRETIERIRKNEHINKFSHHDLFEIVRNEVRRIVEMPDSASTVLSLWIIGTYIFQAFDAYPYIWFNGPKGSGKTRALELIEQTAYHAEMGMRISNPALFRDVHQHRATICYDEAENLLSHGGDKGDDQDRISLFNSGYRSSGKVRLVEKIGDNFKTKCFCSYSPKAMASIHPIDEALQSRCLLINMMVAADQKKSEVRIETSGCKKIRSMLFLFRFSEGVGFFSTARDDAKDNELRKEYDLKNRDWELFKPILLLADAFCPEWLGDVKNCIDGQKLIRQIDNQFSPDATILYSLKDFMEKALHGANDAKPNISFRDFLVELKDKHPETKHMTERSIGGSIRRNGLTPLVGRNSRGMYLRCDPDLIASVMKRLGLTWDSENQKQGVLF